MKQSKKLNQKPYFKNVYVGDKVFGLVFGPGVVKSVWKDSYYELEVEYSNSHVVPYTIDGVPGWSGKLDFQTVYFKEDMDLELYDSSVIKDTLTPKQIIKLRMKGKLEVKCPSDLWIRVGDETDCPGYVIEDYLENNQLNRFRKAK